MKTIKSITDFKCDKCGKELKEQTCFPYDSGWKYLYKFQYKDGTKKDKDVIQKEELDRHFCCIKCFEKFLIEKLNKNKN